ncbi:MAG: transmembrane 220 family protein [Balneolaceae bacterium]
MILRYLNYVMIFLFALSAAVQFNDPDPAAWAAIYLASAIISLLFALNKLRPVLGWLVAAITIVWALTITPDLTVTGFQHMFEEIQMRYPGVEAAREFSGLIVMAFWAGLLSWNVQHSSE